MKAEDLEKLQKIQSKTIGILDITIETRNDQQKTMFTLTDYPNSRELFIHKLHWLENNSDEFEKIDKEIENMLSKKINKKIYEL